MLQTHIKSHDSSFKPEFAASINEKKKTIKFYALKNKNKIELITQSIDDISKQKQKKRRQYLDLIPETIETQNEIYY